VKRAAWAWNHFEALVLLLFWADASILAALAGRPALGALGLATVLPFVLASVLRSRGIPPARPWRSPRRRARFRRRRRVLRSSTFH